MPTLTSGKRNVPSAADTVERVGVGSAWRLSSTVAPGSTRPVVSRTMPGSETVVARPWAEEAPVSPSDREPSNAHTRRDAAEWRAFITENITYRDDSGIEPYAAGATVLGARCASGREILVGPGKSRAEFRMKVSSDAT